MQRFQGQHATSSANCQLILTRYKESCKLQVFCLVYHKYKICQALTQSCWLRWAAAWSFRHQQQHISRGEWREKREDLILNNVLHFVSLTKQNCAEYCNELKLWLLQPSNRLLFEQFQKTNILWQILSSVNMSNRPNTPFWLKSAFVACTTNSTLTTFTKMCLK